MYEPRLFIMCDLSESVTKMEITDISPEQYGAQPTHSSPGQSPTL